MSVAGFCADIIIGHELAMNPGFTCRSSNRAKLIVDRKVSGIISFFIIMRKILSTVVFEISAFIVDTLNEQVIGGRHIAKESRQTVAYTFGLCRDRRIPVRQIGRNQSCFRSICCTFMPSTMTQIRSLHDITFIRINPIIEINHLDADAKLVVVHCLYCRDRICFLNRRC